MKTIDNFTYFDRHKPIKINFIEKIIKDNENINIIYDVGCNNGDISYFFQKNYNKKVLGVDLSDNLKIPNDYNFKNLDIIENNHVFLNDATFLFSLYHHILGKYSLEIADDMFLKLLLRTKYLFFDTGNISEKDRSNAYWFEKQIIHFKNENELLNHFHLKYDTIGRWNVAGGSRSVVVFYSDDLDTKFVVKNEYRRKKME